MKIVNILAVLAFSFFLSNANAQTETAPSDYKKGYILLTDGSRADGFIKENIRKNASVSFVTASGQKKKVYHGSDLSGVTVEDEQFICIKGDFFKTLCNGELSFLQKASDAAGKLTYNGHEAILSAGTAGKPGDYFIYRHDDKELTLVSKKNLDGVISSSFSGCKEAEEQARSVNGDIVQLKKAVEIFNNRSK